MKTIPIDPHHPRFDDLRQVVRALKKGGVVIYPTDTIYGIGCSVYDKQAIERVAKAKEREKSKPFSFICRDIAQISEFAFIPNWAYRAMTRTLPGPYTWILEARRTSLPKKMVGKRNTVGVRIPDLPLVKILADLLDAPLVTTSVNATGDAPLADPVDLPERMIPFVDFLLDAGPIVGDPSTVIDATGSEPELLRQGAGAWPV